MAKKGKKKVDYKYNFKKYWSFVRRYKPLLFVVMFIILTIEVLRLVTKFLFKVVIDKGGEYTNGTLSRPDLIEVLIIVVIVFIIASLFNICA